MASSDRYPLISYQPLRLLYRVAYLSSLIARLPLLLALYGILPKSRPHSKWSLNQMVMNWLALRVVHMESAIGLTDKLSLTPGKERERFQVISPSTKNLYVGPLDSKEVRPAKLGMTWYPNLRRENLGSKAATTVLHLHGGAYVSRDGRQESTGFLANTLITHAGASSVFCPQYRLSGYNRQNPFPAALQDALTSYLYLLHGLSIPAHHITISGDSAGGNLAIALLRYLAEYGKELDIPSPANAVLISPWVSLQGALGSELVTTSNPHYATDFLPHNFLRWGAQVYSAAVPASDPYLTPLGSPFKTDVPFFVNIGAAEIFEMDCTSWCKEMKAVEGNSVFVNYEPHAPHDTLLVGDKTGWKQSAESVAKHIGEFIRGKKDDTLEQSYVLPS